jgi:hypothetical protein
VLLLLMMMKKIDYHFPKRWTMKIVEKVLNVEKDHPMLVLNDQKNLNVFVVVVVVVVVLVHSEMIDKNMNFL